jgi:hypothetical protein
MSMCAPIGSPSNCSGAATRRHGAHAGPSLSPSSRPSCFAMPKSRLHGPFGRDHDVRRFQITVDDEVAVCMPHRVAHFAKQSQPLAERAPVLAAVLRETRAVTCSIASGVHRRACRRRTARDAGMVELRSMRCSAAKRSRRSGESHASRNMTAARWNRCAPREDDSHAALANSRSTRWGRRPRRGRVCHQPPAICRAVGRRSFRRAVGFEHPPHAGRELRVARDSPR